MACEILKKCKEPLVYILQRNSLMLSNFLLEINSTRFYPERAICNHMYNAAPKLCMSKAD